MAIEKFLAMEDGEPGYAKTGTVTHVPFPAGGNGVHVQSNSIWPPWDANVPSVVVPVNSVDVHIEFTSTTHWRLGLTGNVNGGQCVVYFQSGGIGSYRRGAADGTQSDSDVQATPITEGMHRWGVRFVLGNPGLLIVMCDGVEVVRRAYRTTANSAAASYASAYLTAPQSSPDPATFDSVVIADDFQGDCHVDYLVPDGNGDTSQWVGSDSDSVDNWELVDEIPASATDYVEADATDLRDLYAVANLPASGVIKAVQAVVHPWKLGPGLEIPTSTILKTGSGEHTDLIEGMSTVMQGLEAPIRTTRPGGGAWTVSDVNNLQIGVTTEEP